MGRDRLSTLLLCPVFGVHYTAQPHQVIPVELIGSAEVVDDLGDRLASFGVADVVGELEVLDHRSIFVFASRCS
jgi:hypothetical protein